jgi:large conductance mechanosensitive channel
MFQEFKTFIARGNVLDLAVAVVIGAAFGTIISSLTGDVIMPIIGAVTGGVDFSSHYILLGSVPATYTGALDDYAALKKAGVAMIGFGSFISAIINFVIIAFVIFMVVRAANRLVKPVVVGPAVTPTEALLAEIRDELRAGKP